MTALGRKKERSVWKREGNVRLFAVTLLLMCSLSPRSLFSQEDANWISAPPSREVTTKVEVREIVGLQSDYHYSSMSKPNPFVPPLLSTLLAKVELPIVSVLQKYPLWELNVVGVWILRNGERKAMVMTPGNEGVVVTLGDSIGQRGGKIVEIGEKYATVREFSLASDGTRQFEDFKLWLEGEQALPEDKIIIRASKLGLPNQFGYGKHNYLKSENYEERRKDILDQAELEPELRDGQTTIPVRDLSPVEPTSPAASPIEQKVPEVPATPQLDEVEP
ncbi:MAG: pilus assembly protein PilP [Deltaproteobacteria bacterium]|nr:pilus assembly protein PilP [Deltaproteobacteria bacterium]